MQPNTASLRKVLRMLNEHGAINYSHNEIDSAGLNANDNPDILPLIDPIVNDLCAKVLAAGVRYDAVVGIPTGGNQWAERFAAIASKYTKRSVPVFKLQKIYTREFSLIDGQSVKPGARLLVIDDTIYRGHTSNAAVSVLKNGKFKIAGLAFPVAIGNVGAKYWEGKKIPVFSTFNGEFIVQMIDDSRRERGDTR